MSSEEVGEWRAYEAIEPFGERRADYRAASVCLTTALANGAKNVELEDFLLSRQDPVATPRPLNVRGFAHALGARVVKREPE